MQKCKENMVKLKYSIETVLHFKSVCWSIEQRFRVSCNEYPRMRVRPFFRQHFKVKPKISNILKWNTERLIYSKWVDTSFQNMLISIFHFKRSRFRCFTSKFYRRMVTFIIGHSNLLIDELHSFVNLALFFMLFISIFVNTKWCIFRNFKQLVSIRIIFLIHDISYIFFEWTKFETWNLKREFRIMFKKFGRFPLDCGG